VKTVFGRFLAPLVLVASTLLCLACNETKTPTEPVAFVSPTPAPTPIPQPAQPASMSGKVTWIYGDGGPIAGASVSCQGRSAITSSDGTYSLTGLMSGMTTVTVTVNLPTILREDFPIELKPGSNTVDLGVL